MTDSSTIPSIKLSLSEYPFRSHWLDRAGIRQHYLDEGAGAPVLMLHGNPSWSYHWRRLVLELRDRYRCIVPDHIGMGWSARPAEDRYTYTLKSRVDDLDALTTDLIERAGAPATGWTLVVHDWGGPIGLAWADRHPERVSHLVVLNTAAFLGRYADGLPPTLRLPLEAIKRRRLAARLILRHNAFLRGATRYGVTRPMPPDVRAGYLAPYDRPDRRLSILRFVQDIPLRPGDPAWDELQHAERAVGRFADRPVFIGWGLRDPVLRPVFLDEWRRRLPDATVRVHRDAGHYVLEDRTDLVAEIRAFLTGQQS